MKGKPWPSEDEKKLSDWVAMDVDLDAITFSFDGKYTKEGIRQKIISLGLVEQQHPTFCCSSDSAESVELCTVKDALELQMKAMRALDTPGLSRNEVSRLNRLVEAAVKYQAGFARFLNYRGLERELLEYQQRFEELKLKYEELQAKSVGIGKKSENFEPT